MSVAIITGASSGIGREFAKQLRDDFGISEFWFVARREERMQRLAEELSVKAKILALDLSTSEGLSALEKELLQNKPKVSYLVNAAGFGKFGGCGDIASSDVENMINLNVRALVRITEMTLPYIEKGGRIIQLGSASAFTPLPYFNVYASTKAFVVHYTKALNYEIKHLGIRATCLCPCWVDTEFIGCAKEGDECGPKKFKPLLSAPYVVRRCLKKAKRGRTLCVVNWFTKLQHVLYKLVPTGVMSRIWLKMIKVSKGD